LGRKVAGAFWNFSTAKTPRDLKKGDFLCALCDIKIQKIVAALRAWQNG
jgi:hypothetical protein